MVFSWESGGNALHCRCKILGDGCVEKIKSSIVELQRIVDAFARIFIYKCSKYKLGSQMVDKLKCTHLYSRMGKLLTKLLSVIFKSPHLICSTFLSEGIYPSAKRFLFYITPEKDSWNKITFLSQPCLKQLVTWQSLYLLVPVSTQLSDLRKSKRCDYVKKN